MPRGGRRAGAGRKSDPDLRKLRTLLDECIKSDDRQSIIETARDEAIHGGRRLGRLAREWLSEKPLV